MKQNKEKEVLLTQERLKEILSYDKYIGIFTRKLVTSNSVKVGQEAGSFNKVSGYRQIMVDNTIYQAHRLVFLYVTGAFPENDVDHINGVRNDNRLSNLRDIKPLENQRNASLRKDNYSGMIGVYWHRRDKKWYAQIGINGNLKYLGTFTDIDDAIKARKEANIKYNYHPNHGKIAKKEK